MKDRVALVTGSARGIGRAIAEALAADGMRVVGLDLLEQEQGPMERTLQADLSDPAVPAEVAETVGAIDVLVNNAGYFVHKPIDDFTLEEYDRTIAINQRAPFLLCKAILPGMAERGFGRVVNISSVGARTGGLSESAVYNTTKAASISLTKFIARNYGPDGVRANAVAPGAVETFMTEHVTEETRAAWIEATPLRRFADPSEIASVVSFLVGDGASFVQGATLDVNGGWVMV